MSKITRQGKGQGEELRHIIEVIADCDKRQLETNEIWDRLIIKPGEGQHEETH